MTKLRRLLALTLLLGLPIAALPRSVQGQTTPDIKTVIETYKQALTKLDGATVASLFDDNIVLDDLGTTAKGKQEAIAELGQAVAQNPGLAISFSDTVYVLDTAIERFAFSSDPVQSAGFSAVVGEGEELVGRGKLAGTHRGEFMGIPATGKRVEVGFMSHIRMQNAQDAEEWELIDMVSLLQQLGAMPAPEQAPA